MKRKSPAFSWPPRPWWESPSGPAPTSSRRAAGWPWRRTASWNLCPRPRPRRPSSTSIPPSGSTGTSSPETAGAPDQGADFRAARPGLRPDLDGPGRRRLPEGHDHHEPGTGPPRHREGKGPVRDPERYFLTIFGTPSDRGKWGWRVEGHHLSLNFMLEDGKVVAATPSFFGANPGRGPTRPARRACATLADREDTAPAAGPGARRQPEEVAVVSAEAPKEIRAAGTPQPPTDAAPGIAYADLNGDQRALLRALIESYCSDMPDEVSKAWLDEIRRAGPEGIKFSWTGPRRPHHRATPIASRAHLPDRVQQHPERRQPHSLGLAEHAGRLRYPAGVEVNSKQWAVSSRQWASGGAYLRSVICHPSSWNSCSMSSSTEPPPQVAELPGRSLQQRLAAGESLTLLDVREPNETAYCKIDVPRPPGC